MVTGARDRALNRWRRRARGERCRASRVRLESEEVMTDFIFVLVILGVFGLLALAAKGAEKL